MAGCMNVKAEKDIDIYVLPDSAKCKLTGKSPLDMDMCPMMQFDRFGMECWPGECDEYAEDEGENG